MTATETSDNKAGSGTSGNKEDPEKPSDPGCSRTSCAATTIVALGLMIAAWIFAARSGENSELQLFQLEGATEGRCVDGSPPAYWFRPARSGFENRWVVVLDKGGQCYDEASCLNRPPTRRSSVGIETSINMTGAFDSVKSDVEIAQYNTVYVHYCSSDGWHGDALRPFPNSSELVYFRGKAIIDEVFASLMGLDGAAERPSELPVMQPSDTVVLYGISAGARGAMVNADRVERQFGLEKFGVVLDSGYYMDFGEESFLTRQTQGVFSYFVNGTAAQEENDVASWQDLLGEYRMPKLQSRYMLIMSQFDKNQLFYVAPTINAFRTFNNLTSLERVDSCSVIFSHALRSHAQSNTNAFYVQRHFDPEQGHPFLETVLAEFISTLTSPCASPRPTYIDPVGESCGFSLATCVPRTSKDFN